MANITCDKCKAIMAKKGIMDSGNSKFDVYKCPKCHDQKMVCQGIN